VIERRMMRNLDQGLLAATFLLVLVGLLTVYSATHSRQVEAVSDPYYFVVRQGIAAIVGLVAMFFVINTDYRVLERFTRPIYLIDLGLLAMVLIFGRFVSGAQSWFRLGILGSFQPSEIVKIGIIITLAKHLEARDDLHRLSGLLSAFLHVAIPMALILLQPDLGTAMVFMGIFFGMVWVAGAQPKHLGGVVLIGAILAVPIFLWVLKPYQQARILTLVNPYADPTGNGYNVIQSMIAVGSGRFLGKGLFAGTQTQLNFVPEHHTDFIFSVVGEEFGFIGGILLLLGYFFVLWRGVQTVRHSKDTFGCLLATGVVSMLLFHILINVGMNLGIMPVTGIPLPFMSFGGSSLITNLIGIGLLANVYMRRQKILF
jgi:rod shape determining protein RodA